MGILALCEDKIRKQLVRILSVRQGKFLNSRHSANDYRQEGIFGENLCMYTKIKNAREEKRIFISLVLFVFNMNKKVGFE